ncbi:MAG: hypothetical protein ACLRSW_06440 [Christensenellaceae bacterium]
MALASTSSACRRTEGISNTFGRPAGGGRHVYRGVSKHVGTALKHFCCNNSENPAIGRVWMWTSAPGEIYLKLLRSPAAKPWTVMCHTIL